MKRRIATVALTAVLLLLPFAIVVKTLICEGISVPQWDDWWTVEYYKNTVENGFNLHDLLNMRANEHRIIVPVILRTMIWSLSGCNGIVELIVDQMIVLLAFGIIVLYWYKKKLPMIALLPVSVIVFSFKLGMLQVWGMSIQWWTLVLFSVLSFYCYQKFIQNGKRISLVLSMLNAVFAAFSSANGILIWLAYLALFVAQKLFEKKKLLRADNVFVLAVGVVTWWLFFQGWSKLALANLHTESVYAFINTFIRFIANPFFEIQDTQTAYWVGLAILICACAMIVTVCLKKRVTEYAFPLLMLMFFFGSMIVIAYGRGSSELNGHLVASASQYATTPAWALVGVYLLLAQGVLANFQFQCKLTGFCKAVVPAAIYAALLSVSLDKYTIAEDFLTRMQADAYIVQHWDGAPDIAKTTYVFPFSKLNNNTMTELVDWLKENRLFLFKHEKDYQYPYNDYINNIQEEIVLPSQRTEPGNYHVDMVNDKEYEDGMSIVLGKSDWMHILGWALDETHEACPAAVYITVDDTYYSVTTIKREDVAVAYGNEAYSYSGIESWIPMKDLEPGKHDVELTVLSADSKSYYVAAILSIEISDSESLAGE